MGGEGMERFGLQTCEDADSDELSPVCAENSGHVVEDEGLVGVGLK